MRIGLFISVGIISLIGYLGYTGMKESKSNTVNYPWVKAQSV